MSADSFIFDDEDFRPDPECDETPTLPEGTYTNQDHQARILEISPQKIEWTNDKGPGKVVFVNINAIVIDPDQGAIFVRSNPFNPCNTQLSGKSGSMWPQFASSLGLDSVPLGDESIGDYWSRIGEESKDMAVTVTAGLSNFVRKEDRLTPEQQEKGIEPKRTKKNFIRNIVRE